MPNCPNCGRSTLRTVDWVCQWCGYPLISNSFKKLDMTFREFQDQQKAERPVTGGRDFQAVESYDARSSKLQSETEPEQEIEPEIRQEPEPEAEDTVELELEPEDEPEIEPEDIVEPEPEQELEDNLEIEVVAEEEEEITPVSEDFIPEPELESNLEPESLPEYEPQSESGLEAEPEPEPEPEPETEPEPEPELQNAAPPVTLDSLDGDSVVTVDELVSLFRADRNAIQTRLNGNSLAVRGKLTKIFLRDHIDVRYLILDTLKTRETLSVRCGFEKANAGGLLRLNEGETVTVRGDYDGVGKNIIFKNCELL